ncbi:MAG TPA: TIGR04053 family radical SAM/SPASM domain-containing protein [Terriglobales bacterium]|nr:TIGR04053 family radical SAM/SPASM domain-containing protein [Terriglobales bacterium]
MEPRLDFNQRPFIVIWETTQACDLACVHCRACAQPLRNALELSTEEAKRLIDEVKALEAPVFVLTGGDPLKRPDIFELVEYASTCGVRISLTPGATPLLTREAIHHLKQCGLARLAVSLDGPSASIHDAFRRVPGSYEWTLSAVRWAREVGLPVQINTTITRHNLQHLDSMIALLEGLDIVLWSVFFLVPTGRGSAIDLISADEFEQVFERLYKASRRVSFDIKSTEAQHYRRFLLQRRTEEKRKGNTPSLPSGLSASAQDGIGRAPRGINDGKGFVFISHLGEVFPSGFLPLSAGNVRRQSLTELYRHSPLFVALRDTSNLKGKCGVCEFREVCGGSRARAYALTGDPFAEEPCCVWQPKTRVTVSRQDRHSMEHPPAPDLHEREVQPAGV